MKRISILSTALVFGISSTAMAGEWIADKNDGCKVWNPHPQPGESITWSGGCSGGKANGPGTLRWYEYGEPTGLSRGNMRAGRLHGRTTTIKRDGTSWEGYYYNDKPIHELHAGNYLHGEIDRGEQTYGMFYVPGDELGVFTLKNTSRTSDLDIFIYSNWEMTRRLAQGDNGGTTTELELAGLSGSGRYVFFSIQNTGAQAARYKLNAHSVDIAEKVAEALVSAGMQFIATELIKGLLDIEDDDEAAARNAQRAAVAAISALSGKNLGQTSAELIISEIKASLRRELGYGFMGNLAVSSAISILRDIYRYH